MRCTACALLPQYGSTRIESSVRQQAPTAATDEKMGACGEGAAGGMARRAVVRVWQWRGWWRGRWRRGVCGVMVVRRRLRPPGGEGIRRGDTWRLHVEQRGVRAQHVSAQDDEKPAQLDSANAPCAVVWDFTCHVVDQHARSRAAEASAADAPAALGGANRGGGLQYSAPERRPRLTLRRNGTARSLSRISPFVTHALSHEPKWRRCAPHEPRSGSAAPTRCCATATRPKSSRSLSCFALSRPSCS